MYEIIYTVDVQLIINMLGAIIILLCVLIFMYLMD